MRTAENNYIVAHTKRRGRGPANPGAPGPGPRDRAERVRRREARGRSAGSSAPGREAVRRTPRVPCRTLLSYQIPTRTRFKQLLPASFRKVCKKKSLVFHRCIAIDFCASKCLLFFYPDLGGLVSAQVAEQLHHARFLPRPRDGPCSQL